MAFSVQMPALGESVTEGTVIRWLKQEGDHVDVDEPLVEVSTDKVDTEIPSPAAGVLTKIIAREDDTVAVGAELAIIGGGTEARAGETAEPATQTPEQPLAPPPAAEPPPPATPSDTTTPVLMPELGESVTEGTITRWLKKVGDSVQVDEPLVEVSTDKVDTEIPSPAAGTLLSIIADEDDTVAVGGELARIGVPSRADSASTPTSTPTPEPAPAPEPTPPAAPTRVEQTQPEEKGAIRPYVTPLVRKLADENNINLTEINGTGVGGRIRKQDVLAAAQAKKVADPTPATTLPTATPAPIATMPAPVVAQLRGTTQKASRIRQITAKKTRESLQATAQLTQTHEVDMTKVVALRAKAKTAFAEREGVNLTYLPFIAKAVIDALKIHPNINASYHEDSKEIVYYDAEHLGFAVDTEQGLLSPVIHHAGNLSLAGLARAIADIATRARSGDLKPDELSGGTFTITNIGSQGALFDTPILVPPQAAMLGTGAIVKRPRIIVDGDGNESIGVRSICYLPLTYDHRLIDGADAGRFLTTVKDRLEEAAFEADLGL